MTPPFLGALLKHPTPEVAGSLAIDGELIAPPGWLFCIFSPNNRVLPFHFTADVRVPGLEPLSLSGTDHQVVRGGLATHPDGTSATPQTIATLLKIARKYQLISGSKLSVNDLSLPAGGLFDIQDNWGTPHKSHRNGKAADINLTNIAGVKLPCNPDEDLHKAVEFVAAGAARPSLYCEDRDDPEKDFKHIDF